MKNMLPVPEMRSDTGLFFLTQRGSILPNSFAMECYQVAPSSPTSSLLMRYFCRSLW